MVLNIKLVRRDVLLKVLQCEQLWYILLYSYIVISIRYSLDVKLHVMTDKVCYVCYSRFCQFHRRAAESASL